jgi:hypothetical protein
VVSLSVLPTQVGSVSKAIIICLKVTRCLNKSILLHIQYIKDGDTAAPVPAFIYSNVN